VFTPARLAVFLGQLEDTISVGLEGGCSQLQVLFKIYFRINILNEI
jgi:hypothetical protein